MFENLKAWDRELLIFLNSLGIEELDRFWIFVTKIESWTPFFVLLVFLIFYYFKGRERLLILGFSLSTFAITLFLTEYCKRIVGRLRPNNEADLAGQLRILQDPDSFGFFSGHASSSFAIVIFLVLVLESKTKWSYSLFIWPALFVYSRIYVGVHYPSDLLVGAMFGTTMAYISYSILKRIEKGRALANPWNSEAIPNWQ